MKILIKRIFKSQQNIPLHLQTKQRKTKVGLKFLGTFESSFLEKLKTTPNRSAYQSEVKKQYDW